MKKGYESPRLRQIITRKFFCQNEIFFEHKPTCMCTKPFVYFNINYVCGHEGQSVNIIKTTEWNITKGIQYTQLNRKYSQLSPCDTNNGV